MTKKSFIKFLIISFAIFSIFIALILTTYLKIIPSLVQNEFVINKIETILEKSLKIDAEIKKPVLNTSLSSKINFSVNKIELKKAEKLLFLVENFDINLSLKNLFKQEIILNKFGADDLYININDLISLFPQEEKKEEKKKSSSFKINIFNSLLYLKNSTIIYKIENGALIKVTAKNLEVDNAQKGQRFVHFDFLAEILKDSQLVTIKFADKNRVFFKEEQFFIEKCPFEINKSKMFFDFIADKKNNFEFLVYTQKFQLTDILKLLQTNIIENNIEDILIFFKELKGDFNLALKINKKGINGEINVNNLSTKLTPLADIPVKINGGKIKLDNQKIVLSDFNGFYDNKKFNTISLEGSVKDYLKSMDTNIDVKVKITNDFMSKYLSKLTGVKFELLGNALTQVTIKSINNNFDIWAAGKIEKGDDILIEGMALSPKDYDRALKTELSFENNILNIKDVSYYIASNLIAGSNIKPILTLSGNFDILKNKLLDIGFNIPQPLPSEFLNILIGQKMFKKGTFSGNLHYHDNNSSPYISGNMKAEKIIIPSQRLFLRKGEIKTENNLLKINAQGAYRRTKYELDGSFQNKISFPIVVKTMDLKIGKIDIDRLLHSMNTTAQQQNIEQINETINTEEDIANSDGAPTFDISNIIIENSSLTIEQGNYKEINFSDVIATLTLDKDNQLQVKSNKFNIAEGYSSAKIDCDLKNHNYKMILGVKDINSDAISSTLLNLPREISGKASGIISLYTDKTLKLNGFMKFNIKDGKIQKVGLIEYALNFASIFRNPLTMISPATLSDIINIPEGQFDKISGDINIKDNVITLLKIKSQAPQLATYIVGYYHLEKGDAILRIYTKFSNKDKGFAGFLRKISLNSLANKIPLNSRNDANYYSSELKEIPELEINEEESQVFLTKIDGNIEQFNFLSSLKKIK